MIFSTLKSNTKLERAPNSVTISANYCIVCNKVLYRLPPDPFCGGGWNPNRCLGWEVHPHIFNKKSDFPFCESCGQRETIKTHQHDLN